MVVGVNVRFIESNRKLHVCLHFVVFLSGSGTVKWSKEGGVAFTL
jgi:hypothetical protein